MDIQCKLFVPRCISLAGYSEPSLDVNNFFATISSTAEVILLNHVASVTYCNCPICPIIWLVSCQRPTDSQMRSLNHIWFITKTESCSERGREGQNPKITEKNNASRCPTKRYCITWSTVVNGCSLFRFLLLKIRRWTVRENFVRNNYRKPLFFY